MKLLISTLGLLALTSCTLEEEFSHDPLSAEATADETWIYYDRLEKISLYNGPPLRQHPTLMSNWFLRHVSSDSGPGSTVIRIDDYHHGEWNFLSRADTAQGEPLEMERIGGNVLEVRSSAYNGTTKVVESYLIRPTPEQVAQWAETGVEIQLSCPTGRNSFEIPAYYVQGFLSVAQAAYRARARQPGARLKPSRP